MTDHAKPGYLYQFSTDLGGGQSIAVSGNIAIGATKELINAEFDLIRNAVERQRAKSAVDGVKQMIERGKATLARLQADITAIDNKYANRQPNAGEKAQRNNAVASADDLKKQLEKQEEELELLKKQAE